MCNTRPVWSDDSPLICASASASHTLFPALTVHGPERFAQPLALHIPCQSSSLLHNMVHARQGHLRRSWPFHGGELLRLLMMLVEWKTTGAVGGEPREVTGSFVVSL